MKQALCGKYPCHHICSRVCHCPAGEERCRWYALFDKASRVPPPGVNPVTGEITGRNEHLEALSGPLRKAQQATFTPSHQVSTTPAKPAPRRSLRVSLDKLVSEAGFPADPQPSYGRLYRHGASYWLAGMIPKKEASRKTKIAVFCVLAVFAVLIIWGAYSQPQYESGRAVPGQTYENIYQYDQ